MKTLINKSNVIHYSETQFILYMILPSFVRLYVLILKKNLFCFESTMSNWAVLRGVGLFLNDVQSHLDQETSQVRSKESRYIQAQCNRKGGIHSVCKLIISAFQIQVRNI